MSEITREEILAGLVRAAEATWSRGIRDTQPGYHGDVLEIAEIIRVGGAEWVLEDGVRYAEDLGMMWCGMTIGYLGAIVGDHIMPGMCVDVRLDRKIGRYVTPSGYRLAARTKWEQAGHKRAEEIAPEEIAPGDIVCMYTGRTQRKEVGDHVMLATSPVDAEGHYTTIEGNAYGWLPDGSWGEGVIKRDRRGTGKRGPRHIDQVARVWRFRREHFVGGAL